MLPVISLIRLTSLFSQDSCRHPPSRICCVTESGSFSPFEAGTGRIPPKGSYAFKEATFVQSLARVGYETICIGGVNFFSKRNDIGRVFPDYFNKSYWLPTFGCTDKNSAANRVDFAVDKLEKYPADRKVFMYINFSAIHYPNCHYVEGKKKDDKESHAAALRYVDSQLPRLFEAFEEALGHVGHCPVRSRDLLR